MRRRGELEDPVAQGTIITVFGAKGGIGKTTIASNLAVALAEEAHQTVALVDMDTRFGDVAITMDIPVERSIADLARNLDNVDRNVPSRLPRRARVRRPHPPGADSAERLAQPQRSTISATWSMSSRRPTTSSILDTPGTFNEIVAAAIEVGTMILLITTLDMASIKDTVLALEMLHERFGNDDERIKVVLNRAGMDTGVREKDVERTLDTAALVEDPPGQRSREGRPAGPPDRDEPAEQPGCARDPRHGPRPRRHPPAHRSATAQRRRLQLCGRLFKKSA